MSLGGNFGKPLFGSQTTSAASFGSTAPTFGGPSPFGSSQSAPSFGSSPNVFQGGSIFGGGTTSSVAPPGSFGMPPSGAAPTTVPPSPFGQAQPAFGNTGTSVNSGQPAFGQNNPSFFGSGSTFGNSQAAFASSASFPGTSFNQPSFAGGTTSLGGFGSVGLGTQTNQSLPTFGNSSAAFGAKNIQTSNPFSTTAFGNTPPPNVSTSFAQGSVQGSTLKGTGNPKFQPVQEYDGGGVNVKYMSISRMPDYQDKSFEELRYEDYLLGKKNSSSLATFQPAGTGFGTSSMNTGFGGPSSGFFSSSPAISTPSFGTSGSSLFGNTTTAFGSSQPSSVPGIGLGSTPFGQTSTGFGSSSSVFGGSSSFPAFGSQSGASFQAATPFGLSASSSSLFSGSASQKPFSGFGSSMPSQQVGSFGSTSIFGNTSAAPSFGGSFGNASGPSQPTLNLGSFGTSFGGNRFGSAPSSSVSFGSSTFASSSPFANSFTFGADSTKPSGSLFGGGLTPSPQTTSTLFGSSPAPSSGGTSLFGSFSSNAPTTSILSPVGQPSNSGGFSAPSLGIGGIGNSFSGLQNSSSGIFGSTPNFSFSAPVQQSSPFSIGNASLLGTQNASILPNNAQPQQTWSFATPQNSFSNDLNTPYGKSPIFEAASLSLGKSSGSNNPLETSGSSTGLSFANGSSMARPSARSFARIHARSLRPSLSLNSPLFEAKRPVSVFSPEHFALVETENSSPSSTMKSPPFGRSDMKRLVITPRPDGKGDNSGAGQKSDRSEWNSPAERKLSFPSSSPAMHSPDEHEKRNGLVSSTTERKSGEFQEQSHVAKPTPLRSPGQYSGSLKSPSVYSSYREFYEENLSPQASRLESVSKMDEKSSAPTLTKPTYYTSPSIEELHKMRDEDLSHVHNFIVGRRNVGEIQWLGETDVRNLDLDRLVIIENREVIVYPNESEKPEIGVGLNKPAKVSLHKVWKTDKKTGQPLKDVASITNFTAKLKSHCEKQGLTFLGYDATQGTWSFEVPHFSRYGLPDSEDEFSEEEDILESNLDSTSAALNGVFDKEIERIHEDEGEDEFPTVEQMHIKESSEDDRGTFNESQIESDIIHSRNYMKLNSSRMLLSSTRKPFKGSIFSSELGKAAEQQFFSSNNTMEWSKPSEELLDSQKLMQSSPSFMKASSHKQISGMINAESSKEDTEKPIQETSSRRYLRKPLELCSRVSLKNSILYTKSQMKGDPISFLSRSFRASIGPGFQVAFPLLSFMESNRRYTSPIYIHTQTQEWEQSFIQKTLRVHFSSWKLSLDTDEMNDSSVNKRPSFRFPFRHHEVVIKTLQHLIVEAGFSGNQHFELVLRLLLLLFVQIVEEDAMTPYDESLLFRRNLSNWLQNFACTWSQEERNPTEDQFLHIFLLLTRGEIGQAVKFCSDTKNFRLACMIAKAMQLQDEDYRSFCLKIHRFYCGQVPVDLDRIYSLLSGDILHATENLSLSWYRTFGLHFWYGTGALGTDSDGLKCSLKSYIDEWQSNKSVAPPVPPHIVISVPEHEQLEAAKGLKSDSLIYDACYVLLCIAAGLYPEYVQWMHLATPLAYGIVYDALDAHKPWLVCEILSSIRATSYLEPKVIISFAVQLEMMHLHTWAFYVLWSCEVFGKNNNMFYLKNVFIHWFPWMISEQVEGMDGMLSSDRFLHEELGVPGSWFEEAAAIYSHYKFQYIEEAEHFCALLNMEADEYPLFGSVYLANRVHQLVLGQAAPSVFVVDGNSDHYIKLNRILGVLGSIERDHPGMIRDYKNGGRVLEEIFLIIQGGSLSLEKLESLLKSMEFFSSFVSSLGYSKQSETTLDLFITCIFSYIFREIWKQLLEDMDESNFCRWVSCLETVQCLSYVPWSCKKFIHNFTETYRSYGISFTREAPTKLYSSLFDLWFPRKLIE
ncbi:hypothetical protein GpartN1_g3459.t1 [Galdieria partita]|uniref:Peptidase S59 domain-containing protein n=1 Tax=Galdieria partita TaxID=83374 RepID=A0A9C7PVK6_9RHOD|nr:hypothetical protein GpartN1_g3459.t1 [Galdieria partita]